MVSGTDEFTARAAIREMSLATHRSLSGEHKSDS
jgi:hypothetical protein